MSTKENKTLNRLEAYVKIARTNGKIFSVVFTKKDGSEREMVARLGVVKNQNGSGMKYDAFERCLLPVYDMQVNDYRMINLNTVSKIKVSGRTYEVGG